MNDAPQPRDDTGYSPERDAEKAVNEMMKASVGTGVVRQRDPLWPFIYTMGAAIRYLGKSQQHIRNALDEVRDAIAAAHQLSRTEAAKVRAEISAAEPALVQRISSATANAVKAEVLRYADQARMELIFKQALSLLFVGFVMFWIGWSCNTRAADAAVARLTEGVSNIALRQGIRQAEFWTNAMTWNGEPNSFMTSLDVCRRKTLHDASNRGYCWFPMWVEPPPAPPS